MAAALTERRQFILKLVVQEFIENAAPVASESLVRKYDLPVSSATVRNELAVLEELGYLTHLHTSAGRIPTDTGYRFFVEHLMDHTPLPLEDQQTIRQQFSQVRGDMDQWVALAAAVLARTAQNASVVTPPRAYKARFKHLELIAIHERVVLLVLVFHDATVMQQTCFLENVPQQDELRRISASINERCADASVTTIEELLVRDCQQYVPELDSLEHHILELVARLMRQVEEQVNRRIHSDGWIEMLSQPEFLPSLIKEDDSRRAVECIRQSFEILTNSEVLGALIHQTLTSEKVQVIIGGENRSEEMREYSLVLSRYGVEGSVAGVLGVIGPTRMAYPRSISTVRYMSVVMSSLLQELYGSDERSFETTS
jgi:heat-inducible transcriptional repressor